MCPHVVGEDATCCGTGGNRVTRVAGADIEFVSSSDSSSVFMVMTCGGELSGKLANPGSVATDPTDG